MNGDTTKGQTILAELLEGNRRWIESTSIIDHNNQTNKAERLINYQNPDSVIITCSDSRVIPEFIFDTEIGDLFVIRIAGNVITPEVLASIEFAVLELDTDLIMILGHQNCGAVQSTINYHQGQVKNGLTPNLQQLVDQIKIGNISSDTLMSDSVKQNVNHQINNMIERSNVLQQVGDNNDKAICSAIYWMDSRKVEILS